jgi:hypothetical protein
MTYERYKTGIFRVFVSVNIFMVPFNFYMEKTWDDALTYLVLFTIPLWSIYFLGFWISKGFLGKK